jgi:hypothetical protein
MPDAEVIPLTLSQARALQIIREHRFQFASQFAREYFDPELAGWRRVCKVGNGVSRGVCMNRAAGSILGGLRRKGLLFGIGYGLEDFKLTALGERSLNAFEAVQTLQEEQA